MSKIFSLKIIFQNVNKVKTILISFNCFSEYISDGTFYQTKTTLISLARRPHEIVLWVLHCGSSHVRTDQDEK